MTLQTTDGNEPAAADHEGVRLDHPDHRGPFCAYCGDVLGVYEPVIVVRPKEPPLTISLAVEKLPDDGITMHSSCYLKSAS